MPQAPAARLLPPEDVADSLGLVRGATLSFGDNTLPDTLYMSPTSLYSDIATF